MDKYHERVLEINEMTRQQVNTVFENVAEIDTRYAGRMRECQVKIKEQIAMVRTMTEFMVSMTDGNPDMALLTKDKKGEADTYSMHAEARQPEGVLGLDTGFVLAGVAAALEVEIEEGAEILPEVNNTSENNEEDTAVLERYITEEFLSETLGWDLDMIDPLLGANYIEDMRALMLEYGLTDGKSIIYFLMTISIECKNGQRMLEQGGENYFKGLSYTIRTRGADPIQLTGPDQREFLIYLYNHTEDKEEQDILEIYINGFKNYSKPTSAHPCDCIVDEKYNLPPVAEYIANNYLWESALWYWCVYEKAEIDRELLSLNECIETYGDSADPRTMYIGIQCAVNGSEFIPRGIGRFFRYWNRIEISSKYYVQEIKDENGNVIDTVGHSNGSIDLYYRDTENDKEQFAQSYKPNGYDDRIAIYESVMGSLNETQP